MIQAISLYIIYLVFLFVGTFLPGFEWLAGASYLVVLAGGIWLWRREGRPLAALGWQRDQRNAGDIGRGFLVGLILPMGLRVILILVGTLTFEIAIWEMPPNMTFGQAVAAGVVSAVAKAAMIAAIEEFGFRGYFLQRLRLDLGDQVALILSSLMFGVAHIPAMMSSGLSLEHLMLGVISLSLLGVALGAGVLRTGRLWFSWGLHFAFNASQSSILLIVALMQNSPLTTAYSAPAWLIGDLGWLPESGVLGVVFGLLLWLSAWWVAGLGRGQLTLDTEKRTR